MLPRLLAEDSAQLGHRLVEVVLLDDDVWPQRFEQLFLREELARAFYEVEQCVEQSRRQRDRLAVDAEQDAPLGVQSEALEFVDRLPNGVVHAAITPRVAGAKPHERTDSTRDGHGLIASAALTQRRSIRAFDVYRTLI